MNLFALNIILALGWMLINGSYTNTSFLLGYIIGYMVLWLTQPILKERKYFKRPWWILHLIFIFFHGILESSLKVAWDVITPENKSQPGIVYIPLKAKTDLEIMFLANFISITPGTLSLAVSEDKTYLIIHAMFSENQEKLIQDLKYIEHKILQVLR